MPNIRNPLSSMIMQPVWKRSIWGKLCWILFYTFVWLQLLGGLWSQFHPTDGWDCLWDNIEKSDVALMKGTIQSVNIWVMGFFWLAHCGGLHVTNVLAVWIFYLAQWHVYQPAITDFLTHASCASDLKQLQLAMWVTILWISITLVCAVLDAILGKEQDSTANEPGGEVAGNASTPLLSDSEQGQEIE